VSAKVTNILWVLDPETGERKPASSAQLNDILRVRIEATQPLAFDPYQRCRETGSLILIHPRSNRTIAAGMIARNTERAQRGLANLAFELGPVTAGERVERYGHMPAKVRSANPDLLERALFEHGALVVRWNGPVPAQLEESGAIVIGDEGILVPEENPLEFLEARGILMKRDDFVEGEGI
jgi:hypothetical protein